MLQALLYTSFCGPQDDTDPCKGENLALSLVHVDHYIERAKEEESLLSVYRWLLVKSLISQVDVLLSEDQLSVVKPITKVVALVNRDTDKSAANPIITWSRWMYNKAQLIGSDWLNRVKHLKSPQPELLDESISFLSSNWFASARIRQIGKPMVITEPTYQGFETVYQM